MVLKFAVRFDFIENCYILTTKILFPTLPEDERINFRYEKQP
jgi:hypothetical protein